MIFGKLFKGRGKSKTKNKVAPATISSSTIKFKNKELTRKALRKGELGEYKIDLQLDKLPIGYKYLSDVLLHNPKAYSSYSQIDHIVISPYGLYVIETKNYAGEISGTKKAKSWKLNNKYDVLNPLHQNYAHISTIKGLLREYNQLEFYSLISFTRRCVFYVDEELIKISSPEQIIYDTELLDILGRKDFLLAREHCTPLLSPEEVEEIYKKISEANITDIVIRKKHENRNKNKNYVNSQSDKPQERCSICGTPVSDRVRDYCRNNSRRFKGKIFCYKHQDKV